MNVGDLVDRLSSLHADRPVRVIDENTTGPLSVASGTIVVDVAYEHECAFIVVRARDDETARYTVKSW
jgi:hypothetical protein